jgi:WhiB family redox-sensing transcriptional regulator
MWKSADNMSWQEDAECAKPANRSKVEYFFSRDLNKKIEAKTICGDCPVKSQCLQWALEHRRIDGVWGGRDEIEIRRTLSVNYLGEESRRRRYPTCPMCDAKASKLETAIVDLPKGSGRWNTARIVYCSECTFSWRSRTSLNAVNAYKAYKAERERLKAAPESNEE